MNDDVVSDEHVLSTRSQSADVNDLCRLCANIGESMVPIYADEGADHGLEIKIKTHLPFLNIQIDDSLPKRICYHCASALLVWNEVFELSTVADLKLRNWFETSPYDQRENKTVPYDVMGELNTGTVEFEDISDVNMFHKNDNKPVNTLNDLQTVSSSPKRIKLNHFQTMLNHELKSPVIQNDEKYSDFKGSNHPPLRLTDLYRCEICDATFGSALERLRHGMSTRRTCAGNNVVTTANIAAPVAATETVDVADVRGQVTSEQNTVIDVCGQVTSELDTIVDVRGQVTPEQDTVVDVLIQVTSEQDAVGRLLGTVISQEASEQSAPAASEGESRPMTQNRGRPRTSLASANANCYVTDGLGCARTHVYPRPERRCVWHSVEPRPGITPDQAETESIY